jgi:hypothetical protein
MPGDLLGAVKNGVAKEFVRAILEGAGYRVVPVGYEPPRALAEADRMTGGVVKASGAPSSVPSSPDFFVFDDTESERAFVEVKYRIDLHDKFYDDLERQLSSFRGKFILVLTLRLGSAEAPVADLRNIVKCCRLRMSHGAIELAPTTNGPWVKLARSHQALRLVTALLSACFPGSRGSKITSSFSCTGSSRLWRIPPAFSRPDLFEASQLCAAAPCHIGGGLHHSDYADVLLGIGRPRCESARVFDPFSLNTFNGLPRRSASKPRAELQRISSDLFAEKRHGSGLLRF